MIVIATDHACTSRPSSWKKHDDSENWPDLFECVTEYNDTDATTFFRGTQTYHDSGGGRSIPVRGFIEDTYDGGLRGCWSRICWVAYVPSKSLEGSFFTELWQPADMDLDFDYIYGYETVVVPGSSLMVGHWWDPRADETTRAKRPFIFWYITYLAFDLVIDRERNDMYIETSADA
ncbi:hypothetical protein BDW68DRAFT_15583 [Aspergillus falconensis]